MPGTVIIGITGRETPVPEDNRAALSGSIVWQIHCPPGLTRR
jgi:hypothetical protein